MEIDIFDRLAGRCGFGLALSMRRSYSSRMIYDGSAMIYMWEPYCAEDEFSGFVLFEHVELANARNALYRESIVPGRFGFGFVQVNPGPGESIVDSTMCYLRTQPLNIFAQFKNCDSINVAAWHLISYRAEDDPLLCKWCALFVRLIGCLVAAAVVHRFEGIRPEGTSLSHKEKSARRICT